MPDIIHVHVENETLNGRPVLRVRATASGPVKAGEFYINSTPWEQPQGHKRIGIKMTARDNELSCLCPILSPPRWPATLLTIYVVGYDASNRPGAAKGFDLAANVAMPGSVSPPPPADITPVEVIVDNRDSSVSFEGTWQVSLVRGFKGDAVFTTDKEASFTWTVKLPAAGWYEVSAWWPAHANRRANVPYVINTAEGSFTILVDQRQGGRWTSLGVYSFGTEAEVSILGAAGHACADVIRFRSVEDVGG